MLWFSPWDPEFTYTRNFTHPFWLYSNTSFCGLSLCHVTIWPARIGISHWLFWFINPIRVKPVKTLTLVQDRLSNSRISLVSRLNGTIPIRLSQNERCCDCAWPDNLRIWIEGSWTISPPTSPSYVLSLSSPTCLLRNLLSRGRISVRRPLKSIPISFESRMASTTLSRIMLKTSLKLHRSMSQTGLV